MTTTIIGTPGIEYKSVDTQARTSDVTDLGDGMIEAIVSVTNMKDNVNDIILPGAFTKSLKTRNPKGVWHHSWTDPIAKTHEIKELMPGDPLLPKTLPDGKAWPRDAGALYVKMEFNLNTERGKTAYEDVKFFGDSQEWSIGYKVPEKKAFRRKGIRHIEELDLYEYSPVLFGAMSSARTATVKDAQLAYKSLMQEEDTMSEMIELKSALGTFAEQFHDIVVRFADLMDGEEKSGNDRENAVEIAEELGLNPDDFEDFYDDVDAGDLESAQEKAALFLDELEEKSGPRTVTLLESIGTELKALETKPPKKRPKDEDDEDETDEWDDSDEEDDWDEDEDEDEEDEDDKPSKPKRPGHKDDFDGVEMKSISVEEFEQYLI